MTDSQHESEPASSILVARGEINLSDQQLIAGLLGRFGLSCTFIAEAEYAQTSEDEGNTSVGINPDLAHLSMIEEARLSQQKQIREHGYRFADIDSPHHILFREHFENFYAQFRPGLNARTATQAFHTLVHGRNYRTDRARLYRFGFEIGDRTTKWAQVYAPSPLPGIQIIERAANGFEPYKKSLSDVNAHILAGYGIVASSLADSPYINALKDRTPKNDVQKLHKSMLEYLNPKLYPQ